MEFRSLDRSTRQPTSAERARLLEWAESGVTDVYCEPDRAPQEFWENVVQATEWHLISGNSRSSHWSAWAREFRWELGLPELSMSASAAYAAIIKRGFAYLTGGGKTVTVDVRLAAVEHLLDVVDRPDTDFHDSINERAQWHRVGLRLEHRRFVPLSSEHVHSEVVRPALVLLATPSLNEVNDLYRKAFNRLFARDFAGAITAATSAVEETLRVGLGVEGRQLDQLAKVARERGWVTPACQQLLTKLAAFRSESDAHASGTQSRDSATLALHVTAAVLLYLGRTGTFDDAPLTRTLEG